jgi:hypothetical protein
MNKNKLKANDAALDGLLRETARNTDTRDMDFVSKVMNAATQAKTQSPAPRQTIAFPMVFRICAAIGIMLFAGIVIIKFADFGPSRKKVLHPCILVASPSGLVKRKGKTKAIVNGMSIKSGDTIDLFKSSAAFIAFPNAAEIDVGIGSKIHFQQLGVSSGDEKLVLERGAINADIFKTKNGRIVSIKTPHGTFSTYDAEFILVCDKKFSYLEVKHGTVYARNSQGDVIHVKHGHSEIISNNKLNKPLIRKMVWQYKVQLIIDRTLKEKLLDQLDKKRKIDICLRSFKRRKRHAS